MILFILDVVFSSTDFRDENWEIVVTAALDADPKTAITLTLQSNSTDLKEYKTEVINDPCGHSHLVKICFALIVYEKWVYIYIYKILISTGGSNSQKTL